MFVCAAVARSPQENDRTELLKEAEPVDYTAGGTRDAFEGVPQLEGVDYSTRGVPQVPGVDYNTSSRGYQNQRSTGAARGRAVGQPPRNIFDDV